MVKYIDRALNLFLCLCLLASGLLIELISARRLKKEHISNARALLIESSAEDELKRTYRVGVGGKTTPRSLNKRLIGAVGH